MVRLLSTFKTLKTGLGYSFKLIVLKTSVLKLEQLRPASVIVQYIGAEVNILRAQAPLQYVEVPALKLILYFKVVSGGVIVAQPIRVAS